jgi:hypothetical protein
VINPLFHGFQLGINLSLGVSFGHFKAVSSQRIYLPFTVAEVSDHVNPEKNLDL